MDPERPRHDLATVLAAALVAYVLADMLHEGVGHGGACLLTGGRPLVLSTVHFDCDSRLVGSGGERLIAAGGTLVNLCAGTLFLWLLHLIRQASGALRWFLWLAMVTNLLQGTGYFLFSGVSGFGDWADVAKGLGPMWASRLVLTVLGAVTYFLVVLRAVGALAPLVAGAGAERARSGTLLTVPAYVAGGVMSCVAGLLNPVGMVLVAVSAAASSFGGTSALAWMPQLLRGGRWSPAVGPLVIRRSWGWIAVGLVTAALFILVVGPGIRFPQP